MLLKVLLHCLALVLVTAAVHDNAPETCASVCWTDAFPVCGTDGNTYNNACRATTCANVPAAYDGPCNINAKAVLKACDTCNRSFGSYDPVCGSDGTTYTTSCFANCAGVGIAFKGPCFNATSNCIAACLNNVNLKSPGVVCGRGINYPSQCLAQCTGIVATKPGPCQEASDHESCFCNVDDSPPVCTDWRESFSNRCFAKCAGVTVRYEGECINTPRSSAAENNWMRWANYKVCGMDGKRYKNLCHAKCAGTDVKTMIGGPKICPNETDAEYAAEVAADWT